MTRNRRIGNRLSAAIVLAALLGTLAVPLTTIAADGTYTVSEGDTLSEIAFAHGTTVEEIASLNGIVDPNLIVTGASLILPQPWAGESSASVSAENWTEAESWSADDGSDSGWVEEEDDWVWIDPPYVDQETVIALLVDAANMYGWDPSLILAQAWQESRWRQDGISHAGAIGVMQVLPETAAEVGDWYLGREVDPWNSVWDNIESGVAFLTILYEETGSVTMALAAYYQGLGSLERDGWFPDTIEYVDLIFGFQEMIQAGEL